MCETRFCPGCPFGFGEELSEQAQNYGCLPTPHDIMNMRTVHQRTWACHSDTTKPCRGAMVHMAEEGLPYRVVNPVFLTESDAWENYVAVTP